MPRYLVIAGTDTGVGKTVVTAALGRSLRATGRRVVAIKPIESGCPDPSPGPTEDGVRIARATGQRAPAHALHRYQAAVTPAVAADREGHPVTLQTVVGEIRRFAEGTDVVLVETAGGLLSPPAWDWSFLDLARELEGSALIVAANRLGCLSHTLLTTSALAGARVPLAGIILSDVRATDESTESNYAALARLLPACPLLALRHLDHHEQETAQLDDALPWLLQ